MVLMELFLIVVIEIDLLVDKVRDNNGSLLLLSYFCQQSILDSLCKENVNSTVMYSGYNLFL